MTFAFWLFGAMTLFAATCAGVTATEMVRHWRDSEPDQRIADAAVTVLFLLLTIGLGVATAALDL